MDRLRGVVGNLLLRMAAALLPDDHYVVFGTGSEGWFTEHSLRCRLANRMWRCDYHQAVDRVAYMHEGSGRWRLGFGPDGELTMESA